MLGFKLNRVSKSGHWGQIEQLNTRSVGPYNSRMGHGQLNGGKRSPLGTPSTRTIMAALTIYSMIYANGFVEVIHVSSEHGGSRFACTHILQDEPVWVSRLGFSVVSPNKPLNKRSICRWFEMLWFSCNTTVINTESDDSNMVKCITLLRCTITKQIEEVYLQWDISGIMCSWWC